MSVHGHDKWHEKGRTQLGTELKYQQAPQTGDAGELCTVAIRCKQPDAQTSRLFTYPVASRVSGAMSDNLRLASAVAGMGMVARDSQYKADSSYESAMARLRTLDRLGDDPYVVELCYLLQRLQDL